MCYAWDDDVLDIFFMFMTMVSPCTRLEWVGIPLLAMKFAGMEAKPGKALSSSLALTVLEDLQVQYSWQNSHWKPREYLLGLGFDMPLTLMACAYPWRGLEFQFSSKPTCKVEWVSQ